MKSLNSIISKEWNNFIGSDRGIFIVYGILVFSWSFLPLSHSIETDSIWWLFFSVIVSGNFANTVFVSERLNGSMEILLTSGFSRDAVLFGKILFIILLSGILGMLCFCFSLIWLLLARQLHSFLRYDIAFNVALYGGGTIMNAACGAWMSIRLPNPRLIPFVNIMIVGIIVAVFYTLKYANVAPRWSLLYLLLSMSVVFLLLAKRDFHSEKIVQPINL